MKRRLWPQGRRYSFRVGIFVTGFLISGGLGAGAAGGNSYTEDLTAERLGKHHVGARFVFRSHWVPEARHRCQDHEDWSEGGKNQAGFGNLIAEEGKLCHFEAIFPRAVGVLVDKYKMRDLSLQMSKGRWDTAAWGNGPGDGASGEYTPGGAEMWARLPAEGAWESWVGLRRSLSGLYCSSLDGMDETRVHTPVSMLMPRDISHDSNGTTVLRGTLPREPVCTENLIPLIKMLPCRSKTGLGRLLHPTRIFQSDYHSISVRASATFEAGGRAITSLTLEQTVLAVFRPRPDLPSATPPRKGRGLGSDSNSGSLSKDGEDDVRVVPEGEGWSIASLLLPLKSAPSAAARADMVRVDRCPVAARSAIHVVGARTSDAVNAPPPAPGVCAASGGACDASGGGASAENVLTRLLLSPSAGAADGEESSDGGEPTLESPSLSDFLQAKLWDAGEMEANDGATKRGAAAAAAAAAAADAAATAEAPGLSPNAPAVARLDHFLSGRGGTRGVSVTSLINMHPTLGASVDFLQPVPYFMEPLLGTLRARSVPASSPPTSPATVIAAAPAAAAGPLESLARNVTLTPGEGHKPAVVEARVWVPAASTVVLGFDFFKRFLTVDDFPPDPSRGFDVPPPLARFSFADGGGAGAVQAGEAAGLPEGGKGERGRGRVVYAYGEAGLLDTPQPDFSMPFNVITFTSTVITFFLGTAINLLVRKSKKKDKKGKKKGDGGEASEKSGDEAERSGKGVGAGEEGAGRHTLLGRARGVLPGALKGLFGRRRGRTAAGRRIHKEIGRLKDE